MDDSGTFDKQTSSRLKAENIPPQKIKDHALNAIGKDPIKRMADLDAMEQEANKIVQDYYNKEAAKTFEKAVELLKGITKSYRIDFYGRNGMG